MAGKSKRPPCKCETRVEPTFETETTLAHLFVIWCGDCYGVVGGRDTSNGNSEKAEPYSLDKFFEENA